MTWFLLITIFAWSLDGADNYEIYRDQCRKEALFKITDRNVKINGGLIQTVHANSLAYCLKNCVDASACKTFNFKPTSVTTELNCELLSATRVDSGMTSINSLGWKHYEPVQQTVSIFQFSLIILQDKLLVVISSPSSFLAAINPRLVRAQPLGFCFAGQVENTELSDTSDFSETLEKISEI